VLAITTSCATPGERLRQKSPVLYSEIIGTWYLLSKTEFGKVERTIELKDDGTVCVDFDVMGLTNLFWLDPTLGSYGGQYLFIMSKDYPSSGIIISYGQDAFSRADAEVEKYYGDIYNRNNSIYKSFMPPLKELKIRIDNGGRAEVAFYVYTKDLSILSQIKKKYEESLNKD